MSFSDKPCKQGLKATTVKYKQQNWKIRLKRKASKDITILEIEQQKDKTYIRYNFNDMVESNNFIRLIAKVSKQYVSLLKILKKRQGKPGWAEVLVSKEKNKLFSKINKNAKKL
jgi:hypothetical protein